MLPVAITGDHSVGSATIGARAPHKPHLWNRVLSGGLFRLALLLWSLTGISAWGQAIVGPQVDTERRGEVGPVAEPGRGAAELFRDAGESTYAAPAPGDEALGEQRVLKRKGDYRPFTIFGDVGWNWTSNVALTRDYTERDAYLLTTTGMSYQPILRNDLLGEVTFTQQWYTYDRYTELNFESTNIGAGLSYGVPKLKNTILFGRYNYNRLTTGDGQSELLRNHTLTAGLFRIFPLARNHYLYASYSSQFGFAAPGVYERDYHSLTGGYNLTVTPRLSLDLSARVSYIPYTMGGREDYNESLCLTVSYKPAPWMQINFSSFAAFNQSNQPAFEYKVINIAPTLMVRIRF